MISTRTQIDSLVWRRLECCRLLSSLGVVVLRLRGWRGKARHSRWQWKVVKGPARCPEYGMGRFCFVMEQRHVEDEGWGT